jgi:cobalt-zinc-cadmium efflux system outer membrane protein
MPRRTVASCGVVLALALASCTPSHVDAVWPEPRPLDKSVPTYRPPVDPPVPLTVAEEPVGVVSLREVLRLTLLRNPDLAVFALGVRAAEARTLQAGVFPNPEIGLTVEDFGGTGAGRGVRAAETTVQLSQLLELGGKRVKRFRLAGLEHDLAGWDYETKRLAILMEATKAFIDVLVAQERLALATDVVRLAEQVLTTVTERVKAGKVSPVEATRASVPVATARLQAARAQSASEAARTRLVASWGSRSPTFAGVSGTLDTLAPMPPAAHLATLIAQNPDVARWATEVAARQATVAVEYSKRVPDLTVSGGVRYVSETEHTAFVAGISLPLLLFNRNQGGIQEAHVRLMQAEQQRRATEVRISTAFAEAYQTLATAYNEGMVLQATVLPAAQSAFEAATEGYRQGKFGFLDVLDAQRTLFETRGQYLDALATYHKAVADVEQLIGQELAPAAQAPPHRNGGTR